MLVTIREFRKMAYGPDKPTPATIRSKIKAGKIPGFLDDGRYWIDWYGWCAMVRGYIAERPRQSKIQKRNLVEQHRELAEEMTKAELASFGLD